MERIAALAAAQAKCLDQLRQHPQLTGARNLGTIAALEIGAGEGYLSSLGPHLLAFFRERDLLIRPLGNTVYVMPPYCIDRADLEHAYAAISEAADRVASGYWTAA